MTRAPNASDEDRVGTPVAEARGVRIALFVLLGATGVVHASPPPPPEGQGPELPRGAWPGVGLEELRGLRECTLDDPPMRVGSEITCRPPVIGSPAHLSFELGWATGFALDHGDVRGLHGLTFEGSYWATRALGLGVHGAFAGEAAPGQRAGLVGEALGTLRLRLFTDEVDRDAVSLTLGAGYALREDRLGASGGIARAALTRDIGYMVGESSALTWAWEVAVEQSLVDAQLRTVTAGVRAGWELGIREPGNVGERDRDPPLRHALGGEFRASSQLGVGASLDLPFVGSSLWRTTVFWTTGHDDRGEHGLLATWAAVTGPRILFLPTGVISPYVDVQGGPAALGRDPTAKPGLLAEAEGGIDIHLGCQTRIDFGGRIQAEVDGGFDIRAGFFVLRVSHGTVLRDHATCSDSRPVASY